MKVYVKAKGQYKKEIMSEVVFIILEVKKGILPCVPRA